MQYTTLSYHALPWKITHSLQWSLRYGYITNTRVKLVVVVSVTEGIIRDADMKAVN